MVFRIEKTENYTVMSNYHLREKNMSLKAKGLLSWMLSNTDEWDYSIAGIAANCKESETSIKSALKELQDFGYLQVNKLNPDQDNPKIHYEYVIYEQPQGGGFQGLENQAVENQAVENRGQINNKIRNTNKEVKNKENKDKYGFDLNHSPKQPKNNLFNSCVEEINLFTGNPEVREELINYLKMRIKLKGLTVKGWQGILRKFKERVSENNYIPAIQYSTKMEYRGIFNAVEDFSCPSRKFDDYIVPDSTNKFENHELADETY